jgi:Amt family ammonium transporter
VLTGVFAAKVYNPGGADGLLLGGAGVFMTQVIGVAAAAAYAAVLSLVILKVLDVTVGLRVRAEEESEGLDTALHGESGYEFGIGGGSPMHDEAAEQRSAAHAAAPVLATNAAR